MSTKDDETWYNVNEGYDSQHTVAETIDNNQEWDDQPIILEDTSKNNESMEEHIEPDFYIGERHTGRSKPIILPFSTGYHFLHYMFNKLIYLMLFCTFEASTITSKTIIYVFEILSKTITSTPSAISNWIDKPRLRYTKKQRKTSHGSGKSS